MRTGAAARCSIHFYPISPTNPLVTCVTANENRWNRYRIWRPLGLLVMVRQTAPEWEITILDEHMRQPDFLALPRPDLVGIAAFTFQVPRAYQVASHFRHHSPTPVARVRFAHLGLLLVALFVLGCRGRGSHAALSAGAAVHAGGPRIAFETTLHDFGTVSEGDKLRHVFAFKNTGKAPLLISSARASCGCTVAALKVKSIAPGGTGEIDATFDTHGRVGSSRTTIAVESNATDQAHATLTLTANVERLLALESGYLRVATEYGVPRVEKVWLTGKLLDEATPKVLKLESLRRADTPADRDKDPILRELNVCPIEEQAGGTLKKGLELKLTGDRVASGSGKVTVATGLPRPALLELQLTWAVASTLHVEPDSPSFAVGQPEGRERILRVWSKKPNFRLLRVRVLDGPFAAALESPESPTIFKVKVTWNGPLRGEHAEPDIGKLQLISNDPAEPNKVVDLKITNAPGRPPLPRTPL